MTLFKFLKELIVLLLVAVFLILPLIVIITGAMYLFTQFLFFRVVITLALGAAGIILLISLANNPSLKK